jgi:hypothetical protein
MVSGPRAPCAEQGKGELVAITRAKGINGTLTDCVLQLRLLLRRGTCRIEDVDAAGGKSTVAGRILADHFAALLGDLGLLR